MMSRIRIRTNGPMGHHAQVLYIAPDGTETDISDVCTGYTATIHIGAGQLTTATLHLLTVDVDAEAETDLGDLPPQP